jgi:hypothetical protein
VQRRAKAAAKGDGSQQYVESHGTTQHFEGGSSTKIPTVGIFESHRAVYWNRKSLKELAPQVGLEPTTLRLTAECSAILPFRFA